MMTRRQTGLTLIELIVVMAIIAVLLSIAVPGYRDSVRRTRRTDATKELTRLAAAQERYMTNCNSYATSLAGTASNCTGLGNASATPLSEEGYYQISLAATATTFTLTATPQGDQATDTKCTTLTFNNQGVKGSTGSETAAKCWGG